MKVYPGKWRYSEEEPYPSLQAVLDTPFWRDETYKPVRESLKIPIPNPEVVVGGEFITIDTLAQRSVPKGAAAAAPSPKKEPEEEEEGMLPTERILEGSEGEEEATPTATPPVRSPGMAPRREPPPEQAEGVKYGLIHLVPMMVGSMVPQSLRTLGYSLVIVEAAELEAEKGVHSLVPRLLTENPELLVAIIGEALHCGEALASIQRNITREDLKIYTIRVYWPNTGVPPWNFAEMQLLLISRWTLTWRVCHVPRPLFLFSAMSSV